MLVPKYVHKGLSVKFKGTQIKLSPEQECMAIAWVKKYGTDYVDDSQFVRNFFKSFSRALSVEKATREDFDFSEVERSVEQERQTKLDVSKEEKKAQAAARKIIREQNKEKYGYAIVDGEKVEVGNYTSEPASIFMGRGKHPTRGLWKPGVSENDITLNLSPDAAIPPGDWKERVWQSDSMWIARWDDKLRGVEKYLWLADSSSVKQSREIEKFDQARSLHRKIEGLRKHINANLLSDSELRRKVATVCWLIDVLKIRVGDEKDEDEADTIGATTLRPEHISLATPGVAKFDFLGKDSVRLQTEIAIPDGIAANLREFIAKSKSAIFEGVNSTNVKEFLGEVMPGLTAKVFRTYHSTQAVIDFLSKTSVSKEDPLFKKKYAATMANLQAAVLCNHRRKLPKKWNEQLAMKKERLKKLRDSTTKRSKVAAKELQIKVDTLKATRDYNLGTSLKSYIDPRVYHKWGRKVDFDWKLYYSKTLQRKFSWVDSTRSESPETL